MYATSCPCCKTLACAAAFPQYTHCQTCSHRWRPPAGNVGNDYYESLEGRNDSRTPWFKRKISDRIAALSVQLAPTTQRVLEVGCAEGELGAAIKARFPVIYDGIELSRDGELASDKLDQVFRTPADTVDAIPYDLIVSFHVLEHIADPGRELQAWSRLLAPEGRLLIEVPHLAGHPWLAYDQNPEHLHQFTPASLSVLLAARGFNCEALSIGHYESPVYPDSIQLVARRAPLPSWQLQCLLQRFQARIGGPFIAYGIGGDFLNYVAPLADSLDIQAMVDSSAAKWGQQFGRHVIAAYDPKSHGMLPILICSIRFSADIRQQLLNAGIAPERIVGLEEIYALS